MRRLLLILFILLLLGTSVISSTYSATDKTTWKLYKHLVLNQPDDAFLEWISPDSILTVHFMRYAYHFPLLEPDFQCYFQIQRDPASLPDSLIANWGEITDKMSDSLLILESHLTLFPELDSCHGIKKLMIRESSTFSFDMNRSVYFLDYATPLNDTAVSFSICTNSWFNHGGYVIIVDTIYNRKRNTVVCIPSIEVQGEVYTQAFPPATGSFTLLNFKDSTLLKIPSGTDTSKVMLVRNPDEVRLYPIYLHDLRVNVSPVYNDVR